ncbi:MAG TPA: carboxypeptidase regulatory-like domain-containing protein [Bryobacteraceae bacterium]|nr:carboxypeptidase regulatory-like domain-containing protein [Bryobacteraceae bacterium]
MKRFVLYKFLSPLFMLALLLPVCYAQTETGQITGTITDPTGAGIPSATIKVTSTSTGAIRNVTASGDGVYNVPNLLPGEYTVAASAPGFTPAERRVVLTVGARIGQDIQLQVGTSTTTVQVTETTPQVNTETQTLSQVISQNEIRELPNLTRNPYQFVELAGNISDAGLGTRGAGFSINGQREASTNILLDGGSNNDEFSGAIGQQIPLDAVQEFSVLTSNFTAEYGRASGGIVNVVSKSGSNEFHGTAYEFNRVSRFSSNSFVNNANGVPESVFVRNQFGYSFGGPIIKNKLFFFSSTEWTRIRSNATSFAWVPTSQLIGLTPANVQDFFSTLGQMRPSASVIGSVSLNDLTAIYGKNPCAGLACATLPAGIPLFNHVTYNVPTDAGGGFPQNTWDTFNRIDYNLSDRTQIYGRYALYSEDDQTGVLSNSPYNNYDLGETYFNHNLLLSVIHTFTPLWTSQSKVVFNRLTNLQQGLTSRGLVPTMYPNITGAVAIGTDLVAFPGYNPFTPGNGGAFGGPQNILQFYQDMSWTKGNHSIRFGGTYDYIQDNRTYAAYQTAVDGLAHTSGLGPALSNLLAGQFADIKVAVDPQGKFPCGASGPNPACSVTLPVGSPNFSRSNRFKEGALYIQDSWKLRPRLTVNLGLRWEHFGVQHNKNANLDANWYAPGVGFPDDNLGQYLRQGSIQLASKSSVGQLWNPDWKDFAPRIGFAWDVFGDGKTSLRGGYGIGYERNFGNVTFNVIQNPPNYAVLDVPGPVTTSNFGPLGGSNGTLPLPRVGARIVDPDIKTAYAHFWNASVQREVVRGVVYSLEYSGSKGVNLYSIAYPNQIGFGNFALGDPCTGNGDCTSQPNPNFGESVGYRGNQGFSIYHALNNRVTVNNFLNSGVQLTVNYTWSHAIDNLSSTFFEAGGQGIASQFGGQNLTINNGNFIYGLLDPYHPKLDRGDAEFDIRHRVTFAGNWKVPTGNRPGWKGALLGGWSLNPIFTARTGQPFSVFDTSSQTLDLNTPRATFIGKVPNQMNSFVATPTPDTFNLLTFLPSQIASEPNLLTPGSSWPRYMSGRDAFRAPGWWNVDLGIYKDTKLTERFTLQLRAESFNIFNHANLYINGTTADVGSSNAVSGCFGCTGATYDRRHLQLAAKVIF